MKDKLQSKLNKKTLVGVGIILLTALYLLITTVLAQDEKKTAGTGIEYHPDYLSYGDVWAFDSDAHGESNYGKNNDGTKITYNTSGSNTTTLTRYFYHTVTANGYNNPDVSANRMTTQAYSRFNSNQTREATVPSPVEGLTIPVMEATANNALYSVVPDTAGDYYVYAYSAAGTPILYYSMLNSPEASNAHTGTGTVTTQLDFNEEVGNNWYRAKITVDTVRWHAVALNCAQKTGSHTNVTNAKGGQDIGTELGTTTYYNNWSISPVYYNTVIIFKFANMNVKLGPITKAGDTIMIMNGDASAGTVTAQTIFGENVPVGIETKLDHVPVIINADSTTHMVDEINVNKGSGEVEYFQENSYIFPYEDTSELSVSWTEIVNLPSIHVADGESTDLTMNFFGAKNANITHPAGEEKNYTFTIDFSNASDLESLEYSCVITDLSGNTATHTGSLDTSRNSFSVENVCYKKIEVTFTAKGKNGITYPAICNINLSAVDSTAPFKVGNNYYFTWEQAVSAAANNGVVILNNDYTMPNSLLGNGLLNNGTYVKASNDGVEYSFRSNSMTFIVPHAADKTSVSSSGNHPYALETQGTAGATALMANVYRTLTVSSGATIQVAGTMAVGGTTNGSCQVAGAHANVHLEEGAVINVVNGARLSTCGYIYGEGTVNAEKGSTVYMPFSVLDFRGGGYTVGVAGRATTANRGINPHPSGEKGISPFVRYSMNAIQSRLVINNGATLQGYLDLYAGSTHNTTTKPIIGSSTGLIITGSTATIEATYDADIYASSYPTLGKTTIQIIGDAKFDNLALSITDPISATINTRDVNFPIPYNFDIEIVSGTFTVPNSIMLLPGSSVTVCKDATLDVNASLTIYDGLHDYTVGASGSAYALPGYEKGTGTSSTISDTMGPSSNYPSTAELRGTTFGGSGSADLVVDGVLNLNSGAQIGGIIQTGGSENARINTVAGIEISTKTQIGAVGNWSYLAYGPYYFAGATVRELKGQIIDTGTGERVDIVPGMKYQPSAGAANISSYTYTLYYDSYYSNNTWHSTPITEEVACILQGSWWNHKVNVHTILDGQPSGTITMYFAHGAVLPDDYYYDEAGTRKAETVTDERDLYFIGQAEAEVVWADGRTPTKYPSVRNAVKDAVNEGDKIVLLQDLLDFSTVIGPSATQDFIFDVNGKTINYRSTPFASNAGGRITIYLSKGTITNVVEGTPYDNPVLLVDEGSYLEIHLDGGKILITGNAAHPLTKSSVINNLGELVIDLGGGEWSYLTGLEVKKSEEATNQHHDLTALAPYQSMAAINNAGTLTIKDSSVAGNGTFTTDLISNGNTLTATTPTTNYVSVIRNNAGATLYLDGGKLVIKPAEDKDGDPILSTAATPVPMAVYSAVVLNFGDIRNHDTGSAVSMTGSGGYVLYNFVGGTVDLDLRGGTIEHIAYAPGVTINPAMYNARATIVNDGVMTLRDSTGKGVITTDLSTTGTTTNMINAIRNSPNATLHATLTLNGVNIKTTQTVNNNSCGLYNFPDGTVTEITDTTITSALGYALYSPGTAATTTTIGDITGSSFKAGNAVNADGGVVAGTHAFYTAFTTIGNITRSTFENQSAASNMTAFRVEGNVATLTKVGNITDSHFSGAVYGFYGTYVDVGDIKNSTFIGGTNYALAAISQSHIKSITGGKIETREGGTGGGLSLTGTAASATSLRLVSTISGGITGTEFHTAGVAISLSHAEIDKIDGVKITTTTGNGISNTNGSVIGAINGGEINSGALGITNTAYKATNTAQGSTGSVIGNITALTINAGTGGINNTGEAPNAYCSYAAISTIGDIIGCTINAGTYGLTSTGQAANATYEAERALATVGNITGTTFDVGTIGLSLSHAQIGNLDHVIITTQTGNGITATNGSVIGDITGGEITAPGAGGLSTASFTATATAPNSIAPKVGDITGITINAKTFCFSISGIVANAYDEDGALATVGKIENCEFYSVAPAANTGVIVNANSSIVHIKGTNLVMTAPTVNTSYGIYNNGGQIGSIENCRIDGNAGIYNRNTVSVAYNASGGSGAVIGFYGRIELIKNTDITVGQYAINNGGYIGEISGKCTFTAAPASAQVPRPEGHGTAALNGNNPAYTVYNSNQWWGTSAIWWRNDDTSSGHLVRTDEYKMEDQYRPTIGKITDEVQIIALNTSTAVGNGIALYNAGVINEISGNVLIDTHIHPQNTALTTYSSYAIQNTSGGRIDRIVGKVKITAGAYAIQNVLGTAYIKDVEIYSGTAATNNQQTDWERIYYYDYVGIGKITGDMDGDGIIIEATINNYAIQNTARMGDITGKVTITAENGTWALQNSTSTTANIISTLKTTPGEKKEIYEEFMIASIGTIGGGDSEILIRSAGNTNNSWTLQNNGYIKAILEGVTVETTVGYTGMGAIANGTGAIPATKLQVTRVLDKSALSGEYDSVIVRDYSYHRSTIGEIRGICVTTAMNYALRNYGYIGSITDSDFTAQTGYGIANWVSNQYYYTSSDPKEITRHTEHYYHGATPITTSTNTTPGTQYFGETNIWYINEPAEIGKIDRVTITVTEGGYGLYNLGTIGPITNTDITVSGSYAIHNITRPYASRYNVTMDGYITKNDAGAYVANAITNSVTEYPVPTIESIGAGVRLQASALTIGNAGEIGSIIGGDTEETRVSIVATSTSGTSQHAIYNYDGVISKVERLGVATDTNTYTGAKIGSIKNATITSGITNAIQNGKGTANYVAVIEEIGEGTEVHSANGMAVYNHTTLAQIKRITGGIFTTDSTDSKVYALQNNSTTYPIYISGGFFKGGVDARSNAIYQPDVETRYIYPDEMLLSSKTKDVTFADGSTVDGYYFITKNVIYIIFNGGEGSEGSMEKMEISLKDLTALITLSENGFSRKGYIFLGWDHEDHDITSITLELTDQWSGTIAGLQDLLGQTFAAGDEITLYAVWTVNEDEVIIYNIKWSPMEFVYTPPVYEWNESETQYVQTNTDEAGWHAVDESNRITISTENGTFSVKLTFAAESSYTSLGMVFEDEDGKSREGNIFAVSQDNPIVILTMLEGDPGRLTEKTAVGSVTVELIFE